MITRPSEIKVKTTGMSRSREGLIGKILSAWRDINISMPTLRKLKTLPEKESAKEYDFKELITPITTSDMKTPPARPIPSSVLFSATDRVANIPEENIENRTARKNGRVAAKIHPLILRWDLFPVFRSVGG